MYVDANAYRSTRIQNFLSHNIKSTYVLHIFGNSTFQIKIFNVSTPINEYPRYHRLTTSSLKDLTFQVDMPDKDPISSKLVNLLYFILLLKSFFITSFYKLNMTYYFSHISDSTN